MVRMSFVASGWESSKLILQSSQSQVNFNDSREASLFWRLDRIIHGKIQGEEAMALLDSFNTGLVGSMLDVVAWASRVIPKPRAWLPSYTSANCFRSTLTMIRSSCMLSANLCHLSQSIVRWPSANVAVGFLYVVVTRLHAPLAIGNNPTLRIRDRNSNTRDDRS